MIILGLARKNIIHSPDCRIRMIGAQESAVSILAEKLEVHFTGKDSPTDTGLPADGSILSYKKKILLLTVKLV